MDLLWLLPLGHFGQRENAAGKTTERIAAQTDAKGYARPDAKAEVPVTRIPVAALVVADEDDQRPTLTTAAQVKKWIDDANAIYKPAKIQFEFQGDDSDYQKIKNTALNHVISEGDPDFAAATAAGNALAAKFSGKMLLIFRHGPGVIPSGAGNGSIERDFVLLPQFDNAKTCEHQNLHYAARIIGEYLGIRPTAVRQFINTQEAEQFLHDHKDDPNCFDNDGIKDTPPDPFILTLEGICQPADTVQIGDSDYTLPVGNLMSDYDAAKSLSPTQIKWVQWAARTRQKSGMATPTNIAAPPPYKVDKLKIAAKQSAETSAQKLAGWNAARWNDGSQLLCAAKKGGSLTFTLTVEEDGDYRFALYATQAPDFGIVKITLDDKPLGSLYDGWAPYVMPTGKIELGQAALKKGPHRLRFEAVDKYELASDYHFGLDGLSVQPVEK